MRTLGNSRARRARAGFSLVEAMTALVAATIGALGLLASTTAGSKLQTQTEQYGRAARAIARVHETLRNGDLDARVAELRAAPSFELGEIALEVTFPEALLTNTLATPVPATWRYRDLDGDGQVELDAAATAESSLVPVAVTASWESGSMRSTFVVTEP